MLCLRIAGSMLLIVLASFALIGASPAFGSGFAIYTQGAASLGQAAATIAHGEDPSVIFFNPALMSKFEGTQVEVGTTLLIPLRDFKSGLTGNSTSAEKDVFFPSTFFVTHRFTDKISLGLGVFNPFGLATEWADNWEGRYIATKSELTTYDINPVISWQVTPWLAIGGGPDFLILDTTLEKKLYFAPLGLADGGQRFKGDGHGVGWSFGALFEPHPDVSIGASYRSMVRVNVDGKAEFTLPNGAPAYFSLLFPDTDGDAQLNLPQRVHFGVCYKGFYPLTLEVAARWEGWSSFEQLIIRLDKPVAGSMVSVNNRNWHDVWTGSIGAKYQLNDRFALVAGYLYQGNPVPDSTFDPSIPDADAHLITIGTDFRYGALRAGLSYGFQKMVSRTKNNTVDDNPNDGFFNPLTAANGEYNTDIHLIGLTLSYMF
ncbi:OmpP1/FadL family transporter [Syntrophobacter fumaroxidans]|nr:outer membrane protein transport protein [Syntrophobacter fumaroxidans]